MYKELIILSQYVKDHCNYFQKYHLCFSPQNTLPHWKSLLNSITFQNNSEITWENIFSKAGKKNLFENIFIKRSYLLFYGILVFGVQDETLCPAGKESSPIFVLSCCFRKFLLALRHGCYFCTLLLLLSAELERERTVNRTVL